MTHTEYHWVPTPSLGGGAAEVVVHGHWGRPVLWFPTEKGGPHDFANNGLLDAVRGAVDAGAIKIICVGSYDHESWSASWKPMSDRAKAHAAYEDWIIWQVVPFIRDLPAAGTTSPWPGLRWALFTPCCSPYDILMCSRARCRCPATTTRAPGTGGATRTTSPTRSDSCPGSAADHLDYLRAGCSSPWSSGRGQWEDTTGAKPSTYAMANLLRDKGIPHEMYDWGWEWPHDWPSWRAQAAVYLPALG